MSVYIFSGKDMFRQEQRLQSFLDERKIDKDHRVMIDASDRKNFNMEAAIMECDMFSLFDGSDQKAVILREPFFLNGSVKESDAVKKTDSPAVRKRKEKESDARERRLSILTEYLKSPNPQTILIFYCHQFDADTRKKEYKLIMKYGAELIKFDKMKPWEFDRFIDSQLSKKGYRLTRDARRELTERVDADSLKFHNALEKMDLYGKKELSLTDIKNIVPVNPDVNVFKMSNLFVRGDLKGTLTAKNDMLRANFDSTAIALMLAARLRSLYNMKVLYESGMSHSTIAVRLHAKEFAVEKGLEDCFGLSAKTLLRYLKELADLDQDVKTGKADMKEGFEAFLLRSCRR